MFFFKKGWCQMFLSSSPNWNPPMIDPIMQDRAEELQVGVHRVRQYFAPKGKKKLVDCLQIQVKPIHLERLEIIDNEDFSDYIRKAAEEALRHNGKRPSQQYLDDGEFGIKQFYSLVVLDPINSHAISFRLDPFWHSHILHTKEYIEFCTRLVGEVLHHFPLERENDLERKGIKDEMEFTVEQLRKIYGNDISPLWQVDEAIESRLICWGGTGCGNRIKDSILMGAALFPHDMRSLPPDFHRQCKEKLFAATGHI